MPVPIDYVSRKHERERAIARARKRAEMAVEEREALRLEIRTSDLLKEIDAIGNYNFGGNRGLMAQAKIHLDAKKMLLDRVLPTLKSVDMDSVLSQAQDHVSLVQVVRFDNGEALAHLEPTGQIIEHQAPTSEPGPATSDSTSDSGPARPARPASALSDPSSANPVLSRLEKLHLRLAELREGEKVAPPPPNPLVDTTVVRHRDENGKIIESTVQPPATTYCRTPPPNPGQRALIAAMEPPDHRQKRAQTLVDANLRYVTATQDKMFIKELERRSRAIQDEERGLPPIIDWEVANETPPRIPAVTETVVREAIETVVTRMEVDEEDAMEEAQRAREQQEEFEALVAMPDPRPGPNEPRH